MKACARRVAPGREWLCAAIVVLVAAAVAGATDDMRSRADEGQRTRQHAWSATTSTGRALSGTWTYVIDPDTGSATGTWTLSGPRGTTVAQGGWSAAKAPNEWTGNWRATVAGSRTEYSGSWRAGVDLPADAGLADLFESAIRSLVSGTWQAGRQSGAWSIRVSR